MTGNTYLDSIDIPQDLDDAISGLYVLADDDGTLRPFSTSSGLSEWWKEHRELLAALESVDYEHCRYLTGPRDPMIITNGNPPMTSRPGMRLDSWLAHNCEQPAFKTHFDRPANTA